MIDFAKELNTEQVDVVEHGDGPCLVLAGAGSGKTRTITYRVAYLLEKGIDSKNILLVTFTNKAAQEMKDRVALLTKGNIHLPWSGTYHHIAYRILRQYAKLLGYENNFTILDSEDSLDLMKLCIKQEGIDRKQRRFPSPAVIHSIVSFARNAETTIEDVLDRKHPHWLELSEIIIRIAEDYGKRKVQANAMDFDDLLVNLYLLLLKFSHVREKFAEQFKYILVDEYQDTNKIQASIIKLFGSKHRNVLVVGDDAQSIYSFRAADIQHILDFERDYPDAHIFRLETNYRSTPNILNLANDIIAQNKSQYKKELKSVIDPLVKPEVYSFSDASEEGQSIVERILELHSEGIPLNKIAILFRAAFHSQALEMELVKRDIPYDYRGGTRFFERAHVKDILAFLRIYANKSDVIAWSRILNMQVGIGPAGAQKITQAFQHSSTSASFGIEEIQHLGAELSVRGQVGWNDFLQIWKKLADTQGKPGELIHALLDSKYVDYLEAEYPDSRERMDDIKQLAAFAERQKDLSQFLAESSMQESYARTHVKSDSSEGKEERLVLSTIHQAKGLEWDAVFIINLSAGQFPNDRAMREENGVEEERRLFYVAVTRARKFLYMSYPLMGWSASMLQGPSMFIEELDRDLFDEHTYENDEGSVFDDPSDDVDDISYEALDDDKPKRSFLKSLDEL
ncbi:MAG: ATP-dependent helicase [Candidatus Magasanikbacteria bacterium]